VPQIFSRADISTATTCIDFLSLNLSNNIHITPKDATALLTAQTKHFAKFVIMGQGEDVAYTNVINFYNDVHSRVCF
jgi:hypothetical protein